MFVFMFGCKVTDPNQIGQITHFTGDKKTTRSKVEVIKMLNFCILNNPRTFLILLKLFTQVTLLLKLRKACKLRRRNLLFQNFLRSNALVVPAVLNLFFLLYKFAKTCRKRRTLTKPHSLIALLQRYRYLHAIR